VTKGQCEQAAQVRWEVAKVAFADNHNADGWVHLLAMGIDLAAAGGAVLQVDLATIARDGGLIA
jgi:hypothetical protein